MDGPYLPTADALEMDAKQYRWPLALTSTFPSRAVSLREQIEVDDPVLWARFVKGSWARPSRIVAERRDALHAIPWWDCRYHSSEPTCFQERRRGQGGSAPKAWMP
jgi:hypothetical protein